MSKELGFERGEDKMISKELGRNWREDNRMVKNRVMDGGQIR
jgi:hypothetical protein